jgi:hypothetical protein
MATELRKAATSADGIDASSAVEAAAAIHDKLTRAAERENRVIQHSFVAQPQYFTIPFKIAHDSPTGAITIVDKPFDLQINHGKNQTPRFKEEVTVVELTQKVLGEDRDFQRCHNLDFARLFCF